MLAIIIPRMSFALFVLLSLSSFGTASAGFKYMGTNQAGADFGGSNLPGVFMTDYTFPSTASIDYMLQNGMNTIRVPFLWERLQTSLYAADFAPDYAARLNTIVNYITSKGAYCVLDVHNYARYRDGILGIDVPYTAFSDLWLKLAGLYKDNSKVIFGLMNEPNTMPYMNVYLAMQTGIYGVRASGATNMIFVPGNDWTGVHSWADGSGLVMKDIKDPLNNFMFEMHQYFDNNYSGNGACVSTFDPEAIFGTATAWLRGLKKQAFLGEFGIENSPNCLVVLDKTMAYLQANSDVWAGWTWWAAGPWWGSYKFSLEKGVGDKQMAVLKKYMGNAGSPSETSAPSASPSAVPTASPNTTPSPTAAPTQAPPATQSPFAPTTPSTVTCVPGTMKCVDDNSYQSCGNGGTFYAAQSCSTGTYCNQKGNVVYCLPTKGNNAFPTATTKSVTTTKVAAAPLTTGVKALTTSSTTGVKPLTTAQPQKSLTTSQTLTTSQKVQSSTGFSDTCTGSSSRCVDSNPALYQKCFNGKYQAAQSCQAGLVCQAFGADVYCVRPKQRDFIEETSNSEKVEEANSSSTLRASGWMILSIFVISLISFTN